MLSNFLKVKSKEKEIGVSTERLRDMVKVLRNRGIVHGLTPESLRAILEDLGPTYVKLGQVMSMRPDFLPAEFCEELKKLQSEAKPLPFDQIKEILEKEYSRPWNKIFKSINENALGSASIAQVHEAELTNGEHVVIKVQRPGIYDIMAKDIVLLKRASSLIKLFNGSDGVIDFDMILTEMWEIAKQEMDFIIEADHIDEFRHLNSDRKGISCPRVNRKLSTRHILVMEYVKGVPFSNLEELEKKGYDINELGQKLGENYVKQIIEDGFFHADPHSGNIWVRDGEIVWLDLGMMGRISSKDRNTMRRAVMALVSKDTFEMKAAILAMGIPQRDINHTALYEDVGIIVEEYSNIDFKTLKLGTLTKQILAILRKYHIAIPPGLSMFARGILTIEGLMKKCCPKVSLIDIFAESLKLDYKKNFSLSEELSHFKREGYMLARRSLQLPEQISDILKMTMGGQTKINLEMNGSEDTLRRIDKMINKLVIGIISAALLLGSSIICTTEMTPQIMEIPLLGVFGYLVAVIFCGNLLWSILRKR